MLPIMAQPSALQRLGDTPATQDSNLKPPGTAAPRGTFPNTGASECACMFKKSGRSPPTPRTVDRHSFRAVLSLSPPRRREGPLGAGLLSRRYEPTTESVIAHGFEVVRGREVRDIRSELYGLHVRSAEMEPRPDAGFDDLVNRLREAAERTRSSPAGIDE